MLSKAFLIGSLAASTIAQTTTLNLFVDSDSDQKFIGSIVEANCDETTIALRCTAGDYSVGPISTTCNPSATVCIHQGFHLDNLTNLRPRSKPHMALIATKYRQRQPKTALP